MQPAPYTRTPRAFDALALGARALGWTPSLVHALARMADSRMRARAARRRPEDLRNPPGVEADKLDLASAFLHDVERALCDRRLSPAALRAFVSVLTRDVLSRRGDANAKQRFRGAHGCNPPDFLVISPGRACNLRCAGCYADSGPVREKLDFATFSEVVTQAKTLWGTRFFVISGGEPFAWRDGERTLLEMAERHADCFFMSYTNGTLIDAKLARRLGQLGNLSPGLSIEGMRERTDARRGDGVFDKVLAAIVRLRDEGVVFGVSLTATRENAAEILSDQVVELFFGELGAFYAWVFHYMPIGRAPTLELMATPPQRLELWRRMWQLIRERHIFIADFWNSATVTNGCIAAGRPGGYFHVDWNGALSPCVFMPYAPVNLRDAFAAGRTLDDVWEDPFFAGIRRWQRAYGYRENGEKRGATENWLAPCLIRDHHADFMKLVDDHQPKPTSDEAGQALLDPEYHAGLIAYDRELAALTDPVWKSRYDPAEKAKD